MGKSYVTLEQNQCQICGKVFDTGALLLDRRLRERFEMHTVTGNSFCPEHEDLRKQGYIAFIVCDASKSQPTGSTMRLENAHRTGEIIHIRKKAVHKIFNIELTLPLAFIDMEAAEKVRSMVAK